MHQPPAVVSALAVKCLDPVVVAGFWQAMLGGRIVSYPEYGVEALRAPGITFDFVAVDEPKHRPNRLHLDLAADDAKATIERATSAGATVAPDYDPGPEFTVMRDPEGNEFCILSNAEATEPWALPPKAKP